eukprot:scpid71724/ scgid11020/ 
MCGKLCEKSTHDVNACIVLFIIYTRLQPHRLNGCHLESIRFSNTAMDLRAIARFILKRCPVSMSSVVTNGTIIGQRNSSIIDCFSSRWSELTWMVSRLMLYFMRMVHTTLQSTGEYWPLPCWATELLAAEKVYSSSARWDVNDKCVAVLKVTKQEAIRDIWTLLMAGTIPSAVKNLTKWLRLNHELSRAVRYTFEFLLTLAPLRFDYFWQLWFYPVFARFSATSRQRRETRNVSNPVTVSCKGLRGRRGDVKRTLWKLLTLALVNELHHYNYSFFAGLAITTVTDLLFIRDQLCA